MRELVLDTPEATLALGRRLGELAEPGTVVALVGDLGAGKTVLSRGVGEGLAVPTRVTSPTFILVQEHLGGRLPFWHADLYRLDDEEELSQLGLDEMIEGQGVCVVEWADRFAAIFPPDRLEITLEHDGERRRARIHGTGPRHWALEQRLAG
jgi:tRNA threonylcarbamoyladenosine biosynthesis protein TsaE